MAYVYTLYSDAVVMLGRLRGMNRCILSPKCSVLNGICQLTRILAKWIPGTFSMGSGMPQSSLRPPATS